MNRPWIPFATGFVALIAAPSVALAVPAYVRSEFAGPPWGESTNEQAMDLAFGNGAWDDLRFETVDPDVLFAGGYHFVYLEGGDTNADELATFLAANQDALENWVGSGGTVLLNSAPNEGGAQNWGFGGVTMNYPQGGAGHGNASDIMHPIWNGPFLPCATDFTGNSYAHASVTVPGGAPLIFNVDNPADISLSELPFGSGTVIFGGLTTSNFWEPQPDALNLRANIITYLAGGAIQGPCHDGDIDEGEECDDGNFMNTDGCVGACVLAECGDGYVNAGVEPCDDGNDSQTDDCLVGCILPTCGDGFIQDGVEGCDDQDDDDTDACVGTCQIASCGDGFIFAGFEECDDANDQAGDGCTACQLDSSESSSEGGEDSSSEGGSSEEGTTTVATSEGGEATDAEETGADTTGDDPSTSGTVDPTNAESDPTADPSGGESESEGGGGSSEGGATDDTAGGGCGCTTDERGSAGWLGVLVLGMFVRRRR